MTERADDTLKRCRRKPEKCRCHKDAVGQRTLRRPKHVHHFDFVAIGQVLPANCSQVGKRLHGVLPVTSDIQSEFVFLTSAHDVITSALA